VMAEGGKLDAEESDGEISGAGKSIKSLNRLRRHFGTRPSELNLNNSHHLDGSLRQSARTRSIPPRIAGTSPTTVNEGRTWSEEEFARLMCLKNSRKSLRWLEIAGELNRPVREIKEIWRDREQWIKLLWSAEKVRPL
jgi:hypothetical protein